MPTSRSAARVKKRIMGRMLAELGCSGQWSLARRDGAGREQRDPIGSMTDGRGVERSGIMSQAGGGGAIMRSVLNRIRRRRPCEATVGRALAKRGDVGKGDGGQGMTEYIIIVALIAIFAIGTITLFGDNIKALFAATSDVLAGEQNVTVQTQKSSAKHTQTGTLKDFTKNIAGKGK